MFSCDRYHYSDVSGAKSTDQSSQKENNEDEPKACSMCFDACSSKNSVICKQKLHTTCTDCLARYINIHTFESFEEAPTDFDFNRLLRNEGRIICPGCVIPYNNAFTQKAAATEHLLDVTDVLRILPTEVARRYLATFRYAAGQAKIVQDNKDAMERIVAKIDTNLVALDSTKLFELQKRRNELKAL